MPDPDTRAELPDVVDSIVKKTAKNVHKRFPTLEYGDIEGVGWEYVYSSREAVVRYLSETAEGERYLGYRIRRAMLEWCGREMRAATGFDYRDTYTYTAKVVKELLPDVFVYENWQPAPATHDGMPRGQKLVNEGGDRIAMLADVSRVMKFVSDDQYNILVWRYKYGLSQKEVGDELGCSENAARLREARAIDRMVYALARQEPGDDEDSPQSQTTGSRRVLSNAAARARTADSY